VINANTMNVAIDWDPTALHLRYQSTREKVSFFAFLTKIPSYFLNSLF
jgi:hypothetical protein